MQSKVARIEDIPAGEMRQYYLDGAEVLIINLKGRFYCLSARCAHAGAPLVYGKIDGEVLTCPWHGSRFNITDGSVLRGPAQEPLNKYAVEIENGDIIVQLPYSQ